MKRREFVVKSSLGTAAVAFSNPMMGLKKLTNTNENINIGVIGTGSRGGGLIPFINDIPNLNVVACSDIIPFRLEDGLAKVSGKAKGYKDYRKLLERKDIDAVLVATPFSTHGNIALAALDAGKHVFCEKTMVKGYDGIQKIVDGVRKSNNIFQTGHQYHSSKLYKHVVQLIENGKVGNITAFECQWNRNGNWRRTVPDPKWEKIINWRMYREFSGGLIAELCSHQIDFVNWVLKSTPNTVMGVGGIDYWKDGRETYDNIHLIYSYPSGVKATFRCLTSNSLGDYKIKVIGDKGTIVLDYVKAWFYPEGSYEKKLGDVDGVSGATLNWKEGKGIPIILEHVDPSKQALMDFRDNILQNKQPISDVITGANTAVCVQMGLDAMYENKIVDRNSTIEFY